MLCNGKLILTYERNFRTKFIKARKMARDHEADMIYKIQNTHDIHGGKIQLSYSRSKTLKCLGRFSSEGAMHLAKCRAPHFYQMGLHGSIILEHS